MRSAEEEEVPGRLNTRGGIMRSLPAVVGRTRPSPGRIVINRGDEESIEDAVDPRYTRGGGRENSVPAVDGRSADLARIG